MSTTNDAIRRELRNAVSDMIFISESEAPVMLLPADPALDSQERIAASFGPGFTVSDAETFLQQIRDSVDPADEGLQPYLAQWEGLFAMLRAATGDVCIYRSEDVPAELLIVAIVNSEALVLRTEAVET